MFAADDEAFELRAQGNPVPLNDLRHDLVSAHAPLVIVADGGMGKTYSSLKLVEGVNQAGRSELAEYFSLAEWYSWIEAGAESGTPRRIRGRANRRGPEITAAWVSAAQRPKRRSIRSADVTYWRGL